MNIRRPVRRVIYSSFYRKIYVRKEHKAVCLSLKLMECISFMVFSG